MHERQRKNQLKVRSNSNSDIYFNVWDRIHAYPNFLLYIFVGGRGTGKTYGSLKEFAIRAHTNRNRFIYLRRSEVEVENCCSPVSNPFKAINADLGIKYVTSAPEGKANLKGQLGVYVLGFVFIVAATTVVGILETTLKF